jgi:peptidoglycan/xylan/chitin deacetylase (PgdA/CDA1 family)
MAGGLWNAVSWSDQKLADALVDRWERKGSLVNLFFHGVFSDAGEWERKCAYPQQEITVSQFDKIVHHFVEHGYRFVSPAEILSGLDPHGKYGTLTFDDGYFNNTRALPVLEKYTAHATVFVSARHVHPGKAFWWEALYRARRRQGRSMSEIYGEMGKWNGMRSDAIEAGMLSELGKDFLHSAGDADRPFTAAELKTFSTHPWISIGNHTADHAVLTAYDAADAFRLISEGQEILEPIIGSKPLAIAYPNGAWTRTIVEAAVRAGLKLGFTTDERKEYLPDCLSPERRMTLGRYRFYGGENLESQARRFRSDLMLAERLRRMKRGFGIG